jgi:hypothetical protein
MQQILASSKPIRAGVRPARDCADMFCETYLIWQVRHRPLPGTV